MKETENEREQLLVPKIQNSEIEFPPQMKTHNCSDFFKYIKSYPLYDLKG